jgi:hypothetical protein
LALHHTCYTATHQGYPPETVLTILTTESLNAHRNDTYWPIGTMVPQAAISQQAFVGDPSNPSPNGYISQPPSSYGFTVTRIPQARRYRRYSVSEYSQ